VGATNPKSNNWTRVKYAQFLIEPQRGIESSFPWSAMKYSQPG